MIFGPTPRSHAKRINSKMVSWPCAPCSSGKVADGELVLVDSLSFEKPSTKQAVALLAALGIAEKRVTVVVSDDDVNAYLSFRNLQKVNVIGVSEANTRNLIDNGAPRHDRRHRQAARGGARIMNSVYNVIIRPIVSERSFDLMEQGKYTFEVAKNAPKEEIAAAVEKLFNVHVVKVNTMNVSGKKKRVRYQNPGTTRSWKKAVVTLAAGETIEIFGSQQAAE